MYHEEFSHGVGVAYYRGTLIETGVAATSTEAALPAEQKS